jgi:ABC-type cobalamin/Fe3+-siderophores transport system ATPase subunit
VIVKKIFSLGLSVEATSAYLIVEDLLSLGSKAYTHIIVERWSSTDEALESALTELEMHGVIQRQTPEFLDVLPEETWLSASEV